MLISLGDGAGWSDVVVSLGENVFFGFLDRFAFAGASSGQQVGEEVGGGLRTEAVLRVAAWWRTPGWSKGLDGS